MRAKALAFAVWFMTGCPEDVIAPAERIESIPGAEQVGGFGGLLGALVVVRVVGRSGSPLRGVRVGWRVIEGGGAITDAQRVTDELGQASARWSLGLQPVAVSGGRRLGGIAAGTRHTCVITTDSAVQRGEFCWESDTDEQLGAGTAAGSAAPVEAGFPQ